jgi:succinoglycan biosynthesis protein ExoM
VSADRYSVCIATYRRPERLALLLQDLKLQTRLPDEVVVVDNDVQRSAESVASDATGGAPFALHYDVQPLKNISLTRNRTVALAHGEWLAFLDDDERAPPQWLQQIAEAAQAHGADGVLGPVLPVLPDTAPRWISKGRFYDWPRHASGSTVPRNHLRFGNVLLRGTLLRDAAMQATPGGPFDPAYGLTGGEDGDLLSRLAQRGARIVWSDEAAVHEPVEAARLSLRWLMRRSLRGGQDFARHSLAGRYRSTGTGARAMLLGRSAAQLLAASCLSLLLWPLGRERAAFWLLKACANFGKLSTFCGWHYREYA